MSKSGRRRKYNVPIGHLEPLDLLIHRELEFLRAVGGGRGRKEIARRWDKLTAARALERQGWRLG